MSAPLLLSNLDDIHRRWHAPPASLRPFVERFKERFAQDGQFRRHHLLLPALMGDAAALQEAHDHVLAEAAGYGARGGEDDGTEHHTWCLAPGAMRLAAGFDWLALEGAWTSEEASAIAAGVLHFCRQHCVAVLRSRVPAADNQSFSMALACAVCGYAWSDGINERYAGAVPGVLQQQAAELRRIGTLRLKDILGLAPRDGYWGEGSTYQNHVVVPLAMWAAAFLMQTEGDQAVHETHPPNGASLMDILRLESQMAGPGALLPGWDHYGWQEQRNLAGTAFYAAATGDVRASAKLHDLAAAVWDREGHIAWGEDDRMWALLYWPVAGTQANPGDATPITSMTPEIGGWTLPTTGATIEDSRRRSRVAMMWDACANELQGISRQHVNPNHVLYDIGGIALLGDGVPDADGKRGRSFLPVTCEQIAAPLAAKQRRLIEQQYGSLQAWADAAQAGLIGASNTVIIDGDYGYFPPGSRRGHLLHEVRSTAMQVVCAESKDYFQPHYDLTRARRTVASGPSGVVWIVDDYRAGSCHHWTWLAYLRRGAVLEGDGLRGATSEGATFCFGWLPAEHAELHDVPAFPRQWMGWPDQGSLRLELHRRGEQASFVVCLAAATRDEPPYENLTVQATGHNQWEARWTRQGRHERELFCLPAACDEEAPTRPADREVQQRNDLDDAPFAPLLLDSPELLRWLESPAPQDWRRTTAALQTLALRADAAALPLAQRLLRDGSQRYQVHSVAAWCLGRAGYRAALDDLRYCSASPETNTALRSKWAVERMAD